MWKINALNWIKWIYYVCAGLTLLIGVLLGSETDDGTFLVFLFVALVFFSIGYIARWVHLSASYVALLHLENKTKEEVKTEEDKLLAKGMTKEEIAQYTKAKEALSK